MNSFINELCWIGEGDERTCDRLYSLEKAIKVAKTEVEARKSSEESESFFTDLPSALIAEEATCRLLFSDID